MNRHILLKKINHNSKVVEKSAAILTIVNIFPNRELKLLYDRINKIQPERTPHYSVHYLIRYVFSLNLNNYKDNNILSKLKLFIVFLE